MARASLGLLPATSIALDIDTKTIPTAAKMSRARTGPPAENSTPKRTSRISVLAPAVMVARGHIAKTNRKEFRPMVRAESRLPSRFKRVRVESRGPDTDSPSRPGTNERFRAAT